MPTVGRLKNGDLLLAGDVQERLPAVKSGLAKHFPLDETVDGKNMKPILDYSIWKDGQVGSIGLFTVYSTAANNTRVKGEDPWGKETVLWKCVAPNSGIYQNSVAIDNTKLYRFTWWVNRKVNGNGRFYAGCNGYGSVAGVMNLSGTYNTNPYFYTTSQVPTADQMPENEWMLIVAHIFPHTHTGTSRHPDSGRYTLAGKLGETTSDFKWAPETTTARGRTLSIYQATDANVEHYHSYMRMEICDGTEPTIEELLRGEAQITKPLTAENVVMTHEGAAIEEGSTNVVINHGQESTAVNGDGVPTINIIDPLIKFRGRKVSRFSPGSSKNFYINGSSKLSTSTSSTSWTSTFYLKRVDGKPITSVGSYLYINGNANDNIDVATEPVEDGWVRVTRTRSGLVSGYPTLFGCYNLDMDAEYLIAEWQVEPKPFATSFVESSSAASKLYIDNIGGFTDYTICGTFTSRHPFENNNAYVHNPKSAARLFIIYDRAIAGHISYQFYMSGVNAAPYLNRSGSYSGSNVHQQYTLERHKPAFFVIQKSGSRFTFRFYQDGWKTQHVATVTATARLDDLRFGEGTIMNGIYKDLSIYDRALSEDEIDKLLKMSFSIKKEGHLEAGVVENPFRKKEGKHFPFGDSAESLGGAIQPAKESNPAYENQALWIGNATTNLHPNPASGFVTGSHVEKTELAFPNPVMPGEPVYKYTHPVSQSRAGDQRVFTDVTSKVDKTKTYTYSAWVFIPRGQSFMKNGDWRVLQSPDTSSWTGVRIDGASKILDNNLVDTWQRIWVTFTPDAASTSNYFYVHYYNQLGIENYFYVTGGQLEQGAYPTPFTPTTRGSTDVVLPYNTIDCKQDFTITGWFMPRTYADGTYRPFLTRNRITSNLTSYRIMIMNSSTTGRNLRAWFGSGGTEGSVTVSHPTGVRENEWNFFAFRRTGDTVTLFQGGRGKLVSGNSSNGAYLNTDENATTWGWLVGNYSGNRGEGFARDYLFTQKSMTNEEIEQLFRNDMRSHKGGIVQVRGEMKEGRVL